MSDPTEVAREWLRKEPWESEGDDGADIVEHLLDEIDRLRERTYLALRQDTDRQIIADSWQYNRGYNDAIEAAVAECNKLSDELVKQFKGHYARDEFYSHDCAVKIASLRRGDSDASTDES